VPVRDPGAVSHSAAIESAAARDTGATGSAVAQRVERTARRRGFARAPRQAVRGDGAPWIWNLAGEAFPEAIQIVDRFPAKEHLSVRGRCFLS
jgi:transposase